jgi:3-deoxy-manno-octulosonate cytidylyltransferase (CMP-KDO synthetase)
MVIRVAQQASEASDQVIIVTPDKEIQEVAKQYGFDAIVNDQPAACGLQKVAQCKADLSAKEFLVVQGDEPLAEPKSMEMLIQHKQNNPGVFVQGYEWIHRSKSGSHNVKIATNGLRILYYSRAGIPHGSHALKKVLGMYALDSYMLMDTVEYNQFYEDIEQLGVLERGFPMEAVCVTGSRCVDTPLDAVLINNLEWRQDRGQWAVIVAGKTVAYLRDKTEAAHTALWEIEKHEAIS